LGAVGYCLGGKLSLLHVLPHRYRLRGRLLRHLYGTYIEHNIGEAPNLHRPFLLHMAMKDRIDAVSGKPRPSWSFPAMAAPRPVLPVKDRRKYGR